jgi:hypothetical protein
MTTEWPPTFTDHVILKPTFIDIIPLWKKFFTETDITVIKRLRLDLENESIKIPGHCLKSV